MKTNLVGRVVGSTIALISPSVMKSQALVEKVAKNDTVTLVTYPLKSLRERTVDLASRYNLKPGYQTLDFGIGNIKMLTLNKDIVVKSKSIDPKTGKMKAKVIEQTSKEAASLNLDFVGVGFEKSYTGVPTPSVIIAASAETGELFNKGKHLNLKVVNRAELIAGEKVFTNVDSTKLKIDPDNAYTYKSRSSLRNFLGAAMTFNAGKNKGFQGNAALGVNFERGEKPGVGYQVDFIQKIFGRIFGFGKVKGTVGRNNNEVQLGAALRIG